MRFRQSQPRPVRKPGPSGSGWWEGSPWDPLRWDVGARRPEEKPLAHQRPRAQTPEQVLVDNM